MIVNICIDNICLLYTSKFHRDRRIQRRKNIQVIQYVYNIPAKAADALGKDQINFPVYCIGNHFLKTKALFDGRGADAPVSYTHLDVYKRQVSISAVTTASPAQPSCTVAR